MKNLYGFAADAACFGSLISLVLFWAVVLPSSGQI